MKNNLLYSLALLWATLSWAQGPYFEVKNETIPLAATSINSMDIAAADLDGDGHDDLIVAAEFARNLILFGDGAGQFAEDPARLLPERNTNDGFTGEDSEDIALADFDQNGTLDILFVSEDTAFHEILINDGNGNFSFTVTDLPPSTANAVAVLDLNADDYPDIIVGNNGQNLVYINNQDLTFTVDPARWPSNTEGTQDLKLIDLDGDTDLDIIEGIETGDNNILLNDNGAFVDASDRLPDTGITIETRKLSLADVNGDGHADIFLANVNFIGSANAQNRLYLNDGNGFFSDVTGTHLPAAANFTLEGVFMDVDGDQDLDLLTTDFQNPQGANQAYLNDGDGVFSQQTAMVFPSVSINNGISLFAHDLNDDGYEDLYFGNFQEQDDVLWYDPEALGVNGNKLQGLQIGPNPVTDSLYVSWNGPAPERLELFDFKGKGVMFKKLSPQDRYSTIETGQLSSGTYILKGTRGGRSLFTEKIIKD